MVVDTSTYMQLGNGDTGVEQQRIVLINHHEEKLVGILHKTRSKELVILCHGFRSSKDDSTIVNIANALTRRGISAFRFDFAGNGESGGSFQYGNYHREVGDLHSVVLYHTKNKYKLKAIVGHSKGGNVALLYASIHHDVYTVVNISGRFDLKRGIDGRLGKDFIQRIGEKGFIDVKEKTGKLIYRVDKESLFDRLNTNMNAACLSIHKECRVLTIHGSVDETVPVTDAMEFAKIIANHKLQIIEGANHNYTSHQSELTSIAIQFIIAGLQKDKETSRKLSPPKRISSKL